LKKNDTAAKKEMFEMQKWHTYNGTTQTCYVCHWRWIHWTPLWTHWMSWKVHGL